MRNLLALRFHATMGLVGTRLVFVFLMLLGHWNIASATAPICTPGSPRVTLSLSSTTTVYPGGATLSATAASGELATCTVPLIQSFSIYVNGAAVVTTTTAYTLSYTLSNLGAGTYSIYSYYVEANGTVAASATQTLTITPEAQTISFAALAAKTTTSAAFAVSATSTSSAAAISFSSATPSICTVSSSTVTLHAAGLCTIDANQAATTNYNAAPQVAQSFAVTGVPVITFAQLAAQTLGAAPFTVTATSTSSASAITYSSATPTICTVSGSIVTLKASGICTVDANQVASTYYTAAAQVASSFMVNIAPTISVTGPGDGSAYTPLAALTFTAGETPGTYTVSNISYYDTASGTMLCTATASPWSCTDTPGLATGSYAIYATITTSTGVVVTSLPITVTVGTGTGAPVSSATPIPVAITAPSLNNPAAGTIPGNLGVNVNGAATYNMQLALPPGVAGMAPNLSLNYSSQNGNGFLGLGWTLGGMSSVHRCNKTIAQDGVTVGVSFKNTDRLCIDGQRLILLSAGSGATGNPDVDYWTVGATYSTEVANFSRITSYTGSQGLAFKVESKSGRILYYGDQGDGTSYIAAHGRTDGQAIVWALGQVQDLSGNFYTITYSNSTTANGEYLPTQINYGGNNQTGLAAHLSVLINYVQTRTDATVRYVAGSHNDMASLISNIQAYNGLYSSGTATKVREYDLTYTTSASSGRSILSSVQMQALNPQTKSMVVFPATAFSWGQSGAPVFTAASAAVNGPVAPWNTTASPANFGNIVWADFNGDGMMDALVVDTSKTPVQYNIYLAQAGGGFAAPIVWTVPTAIATTIASRKATESVSPYPYISTTPTNPGLNGWGLVGDFNGDGSSDLFLFGGFVCLSQLNTSPTAANAFNCTDSGTNTGVTSGLGASLVSWNSWDYLVLNTTGSGLTDIVMRGGQYADGTRCVSTMTNGSQSFNCGLYAGTNLTITGVKNASSTTTNDSVWVNNQLGNFSGSGLQDVYRTDVATAGAAASTAFMEVCTSSATGFTCKNWAAIPATGTNGTTGSGDLDINPYLQGVTNVADANGDGLSDVLLTGTQPTGTGTNAAICYSTGSAFDCHTLTATSGADSVIQHIGSIDSDGGVKTLAFEYNAAGTTGTWRTCVIQTNTTLSCQTITGGPTMAAISSVQADPIIMFGGFLNDGTMNMLSYKQSIDATATGSEANNYVSAGKAWTPYTLAPNANLAADKITSVTNGIGRISSVTYTQGGSASVYTPYTTVNSARVYPTYPNVAVANPGYVVSAIYDSNGQGGSVESSYNYVAQLIDASGRGSLGFAQINSSNMQSGLATTTNYTQAWPYSGLVASATTTAKNDGNALLSNSSTTYAILALPNAYYSGNSLAGGTETSACNVCFRYASASTSTAADLNGNDLGTTIANNITYDNFGNALTSTSSSKLATDATSFTTSVTNTWDNDTGTCVASHGATYVIGKMCSTSVSKTSQSGTTITRTSANTYFATGLTQTETLEPNQTTLPSGDLQVTNTYTRDGYGNVLTKVQSWLDPASATPFSRTASMTYTSDGRSPASSTNAMGQTESYIADPATGVRIQLTDMNNLVTSWTVDGLGRVLSQTSPTGTITQTAVNQCVSDCPTGATTVTITTATNNGQQIAVPALSYLNPIGQVIRTMSYGFTGTPIVTDRTFDASSRPLANYQPAFASGATATYPSGVLASQVTMDDLNRVLTTVTLDTSGAQLTTTMSFAGKTRTTVNPAGQTRIETRDVINQLIGVQINAFNNAPQTNTAFAYDPFGNLIQTTDPAGNNINVAYDAMGHKIQLNDPDLGIINYSVDPVGRTWKQVSPNETATSQATTFQFDMSDRLISRMEPDLSSYFIYDVALASGASLTAAQITTCQTNHSCGKLVESYTAPLASGNVGMINTTNSGKESDTVYNYDSLGRPANSTLTLDASINMTFYSETDYDAWSRPITQISQHGTGVNADPQKIFDQRYNAYGYLQNVQRGGLTLWQATSQDAANRVVTAHIATAGGGASDGLIVTRCYDVNTGQLDETVTASVAATVACGTTPATATVMESYYYDVLGNVTQRNEAWNQGITGTVASQSFSEGFTYDGLNRIDTSTVANQAQQNYTYSVDGNILTNPTAGTYTYTGGTSGGPHAVKTVSGAATAFTYDADGNQLTGNSRTNTWTSFDMPETMAYSGNGASNTSQFTYGPNHERRTQTQGSSAIVYYGGAQEVLTDGSHNVTEIKTYWPMGLGVEIDTPSQIASVLNWTHMDHLGSIIAMTDIDGNLKEALGYDTWGNRRNAVGAPVSIATTLTAEVNETTDDKGYTGAEQITSLELVHLNGRVYDPLIARFLSGDPHVTDPKNGQNYNRYSYVLNNPMNGTDPTGFDEAPDNPSDNEVTPGAGSGYLMASVATNSTTGVVTFTFSDGSTITSSPTGQITGGTYTDSTGNLVTVTSTTTTPIGSNVPVTSYSTSTVAGGGNATNSGSPALAAAVAALYPAAPADISTTSLPSYYPVAQVGGTALVSMGSTSGGTPSAAGQLGDYAYGTQGNPFAPNGAGLVNDIGAQNGTTYIGATIGVSASLLGGETLGALSSALALENLATPTAAWTLMGALTRVDGSVWSEFIEVSLPQSLNASAPASQASMLANQINASNRFAWFINANPTLTWCPK